MAKHTPGPWISVVLHPQYILNGKQQAFLKIERDEPGPRISDEEFRANARLLAAAPELLEMLQKLVKRYGELMGRDIDRHDFQCVMSDAEDVIAKATGQAEKVSA